MFALNILQTHNKLFGGENILSIPKNVVILKFPKLSYSTILLIRYRKSQLKIISIIKKKERILKQSK